MGKATWDPGMDGQTNIQMNLNIYLLQAKSISCDM
jgi:hypothetical protein